MAVYREGFKIVEMIEKASVRIFQDACDHGAPVKQGDALWNAAKQLIDWYKIDNTREVWKIKNKAQNVTCDIELIDEWAVSDGRKTIKDATERYRVSYEKCNIARCEGFDGFISVDKIN